MRASTAINKITPILIGFFSLLSVTLNAQTSSKALKAKRAKLEQEIKTFEKLRNETRASKKATLHELHLVNKQIVLRQQLLNTLKAEVFALKTEIQLSAQTIDVLSKDLQEATIRYKKLVVASYKNLYKQPGTNTAASIREMSRNQLYKHYLEGLGKLQKQQLRFIQKTRKFLDFKKVQMDEQKAEKQQLIVLQQKESEELVAMKKEQRELYKKLKEKEDSYNKKLLAMKEQRARLDKQITAAIELELSNRKSSSASSKEKIPVLTSSFKGNKNKLPWPVPTANAVITRQYGRQEYGTSGAEINYKGIELTTLKGQKVRAIFEGEVIGILPIDSRGYMVIISHGDYFTAYAGLENVSVTRGQKIKMLQDIGDAKTQAGSQETKIEFQVFYKNTALNPELWLRKK